MGWRGIYLRVHKINDLGARGFSTSTIWLAMTRGKNATVLTGTAHGILGDYMAVELRLLTKSVRPITNSVEEVMHDDEEALVRQDKADT